jgi:hypothetical protein
VVTNPSGGLLSKGHPLGATGLAQCAELTWQLRGQADQRQVEGARVALQHNLGLGGACVVTLYQATHDRPPPYRHRDAAVHGRRGEAAACASSPRPPARPTRSTPTRRARAAGHPGLPVPPTFLFCLEMDAPNPARCATSWGWTTAACCTASRASCSTAWPMRATG